MLDAVNTQFPNFPEAMLSSQYLLVHESGTIVCLDQLYSSSLALKIFMVTEYVLIENALFLK